MMILNTSYPILKNDAFSNLLNDLKKKLSTEFDIGDIIILTEKDISTIRPKLSQEEKIIISRGPALTIENKSIENYETNKPFQIIILNTEMFEELHLNEREIVSLVLHELGHKFNIPQKEPFPEFKETEDNKKFSPEWYIHNKNKKDHEALWRLKAEKFADEFAARYGYKEDLIGVHEKYMKLKEAENSDEIIERVKHLKEL